MAENFSNTEWDRYEEDRATQIWKQMCDCDKEPYWRIISRSKIPSSSKRNRTRSKRIRSNSRSRNRSMSRCSDNRKRVKRSCSSNTLRKSRAHSRSHSQGHFQKRCRSQQSKSQVRSTSKCGKKQLRRTACAKPKIRCHCHDKSNNKEKRRPSSSMTNRRPSNKDGLHGAC